MGVRTKLVLLLGALLVVPVACLPQPEEPVEWVRRPESIIIQVVNGDGSPATDLLFGPAAPDLTLYGDGTLLYAPDGRLLRARLPAEAIRDLLDFIVDEGFMDFFYNQPGPSSGADAPPTYVYVNTIGATNSVRAQLGAALVEDAEFDDLRRIEKIVARLNGLDPAALGGQLEGDFMPEALLLQVQATDDPDVAASPAFWPFPSVELAEITASDSGERVIEGEITEELMLLVPVTPLTMAFQQDGQAFEVGYRPLLPFRENFPEFDLP